MHLSLKLAAAAILPFLAGCSTAQYEEQIQSRDQEIAELQQQNSDLRGKMAQKESALIDLRKKLQEKPKEVIVEKPVPAEPVMARPAEKLESAGFKVDERADGTAVVLEGGILFESGQAVLTAQGKAAIAKLVPILKSEYPGQRLRIEGHTDNQPIRVTARGFRSNWDLSYARAKAVFDALQAAGIPVGKLSIACYADTRPRANNKVDAGRQENRRVEVLLEK